MSDTQNATAGPDDPATYLIRVQGHLSTRWAQWFAPMAIDPQPDGETLLIGPLTDQAALHGILKRIRDLGLPLISIIAVDPSQASSPRVDKE